MFAELLINKESDVDPVTFDEETPLHYAAMNEHLYVINLLISKGTDQILHQKTDASQSQNTSKNKKATQKKRRRNCSNMNMMKRKKMPRIQMNQTKTKRLILNDSFSFAFKPHIDINMITLP